jgi:tetratricopeptide (TPR) repeat protein
LEAGRIESYHGPAAIRPYQESGGAVTADLPALPDFDSLWNFSAPDSTEAAFQSILPLAKSSGDRDYLAQLLTQIARTEGLQMKFEAATATLDEAETLITDDMKVARVRLLLERGRVLNSSKQREKAAPLFERAWNLARAAGADGFAVDAAHMLGIVSPGDSAIDWNRAAIAYAEQSNEPRARRWLGSLYNNLGWTYHERKEYATALELFQKALAARNAEGKKPEIQIARWCVARALRSLGRLEEALAIQRTLLEEHRAAGTQDGYVHEEIAECLLSLDRGDEAKPHFAAAFEVLAKDAWLARDEAERLERLRRLGGVARPAPAPAPAAPR